MKLHRLPDELESESVESAEIVTSLRQRTVIGVGWAAGARIGNQIAQFIVSVILARLLFPGDFGLLGMVTVFTGFATLLSEFGLGSALVQRRDITSDHTTSIFWLNLVIGCAITTFFWLVAPLIARFYGNALLVDLTRVLSFSFLVSSAGIVPRALLQKKMDFKALARVDISATVIAGLIAVVASVRGAGVWSLVLQSLSASAVTAPLLWRAAEWRPRARYSGSAVKELLGFAANLSGFNVINYWARNADNLLIGKVIGSAVLGVYARAYSLMLLPISQVTSVIGTVMFPALSSIQHDRPRVRRIYLRAMAMIALITFPIMVGLFVVAEPFVLTVLGPRWAGVVPILKIMCPIGLLQAITNPVGWIYTSQGRSDWMFKWGLVGSATLIAAIAIGVSYATAEAVAWAYLIANMALFYPCVAIPGKLINTTFADVMHTVRGAFLCAAAMGCIVWTLGVLMPEQLSAWIKLLTEVGAGVVTYSFFVIALDVLGIRELLALLQSRQSRWPRLALPWTR